MNARINKLITNFKSHKLDAFLVTKDINITYLTKFHACESWLFITPKKSYYITDFRYILEARAGLKDIVIKRYTNSFFETLFELVSSLKLKDIGFDDRHLSLYEFKRLKNFCPKGVSLKSVNNLVEQLRQIKDDNELNLMRQAIKLNLKAYDFLKTVIKPGISEGEVLLKLENYVKSHKAGFSFSPIIASGPNSCFPHARVSDRIIKNHEIVLVDMGIDLKGYKSDLTRIFFLGKISPRVREMYEIVHAAQHKAIDQIKPGILARDVDYQARNYLEKHGIAKYFGHSLGHGVGLEIHEDPRLSSKSLTPLAERMVCTVEPAVYFPNEFGIRIEDMILVTQKGCEVLSSG